MTGKIDADPMRIATTRPPEGARSAKVARNEPSNAVSAVALTAAGQPRHPLYAPAAAQPLRLLHPGDVLRFAAPP